MEGSEDEGFCGDVPDCHAAGVDDGGEHGVPGADGGVVGREGNVGAREGEVGAGGGGVGVGFCG